MVAASRFLVIGGAGSIGQAVSKEIFRRNPCKLHVVDLSENNLAELVRDIRSSFGYIGAISGLCSRLRIFGVRCLWQADGLYDYVLNLSASSMYAAKKIPTP